MKCGKCREQFTDYLEESLPAQQQEQVAAHLRQCPDCAEELEAFRRTVAALHGLEAVPPPANLLSRIKQALAAEAPSAQPRFRISWQHLGAVAAAAALVVGFVAVFSYQRIGPISERLSGQPVGTVQKSLKAVAPDEESLAELTDAGEEKVGPAVLPAAPAIRKSGSDKPRIEMEETPKAEELTHSGGPGLAGAGAAKYAAVPEIEASAEDAAAPGRAGGLAGLGAGERVTLGVGPYGESSTPLAGANVEAGARVIITPPPLTERIVGEPVQVQMTIQPQASVENAVVRVQPQGSLRLTEQRPIIYQGPLSADKPKQLSFGIIASETGTQQCQVEVSSELPGVAASTTVAIPGFEAPPKHVTTQVFEDTPLDEAIQAVAREADVKVTVGEGLGQKLVTYDFSEGVPGEAALRILAEIGGCQLEVDNGTYRICCPADDEGE